MTHDVIIVGGGIAGLTAAAFLSKSGVTNLLIEKQPHVGGLVNTFERDGFTFDGGIRATENSGVLFPMLKALGLEVDFVRNHITLGIEDRILPIESEDDVDAYRDFLTDFYPESAGEIDEIVAQMRRIMKYMDIQYGIDNPAFLDVKTDRDYFMKRVFPWMFQYAFTFKKVEKLNVPALDFLRRYTDNPSLLDIIAQHFFTETPAFFALSYIKLYLDYYYPKGGTVVLIDALAGFIREHGGEIRTDTAVTSVDPARKTVTDAEGNVYDYKQLIWAADLKTLYRNLDLSGLAEDKVKAAIEARAAAIEDKRGNDSILTVYLAVDLPPAFFGKIASEHVFYTPKRTGQSAAGPLPLGEDKAGIKAWLADFFALTTYEIGIPALRDPSLAPEGQTGLIVSVLFDYRLAKQIQEDGWCEEFKELAETSFIQTLNDSLYPGLAEAVLMRFSASPLTIEQYSGNAEGAITGWSFTNDPMPAEHRLPKIYSATKTPIPGVLQAGQWTYSPSGLPISILTGKLAADSAGKALGKGK